MTRLRELGIQSNRFLTTIPAELCALTAMTATLDFHGSSLYGSIPGDIGALSHIIYLGIDGGDLTGTVPPSLGSLTRLTAPLVLSSNLITGTLPTQLGLLTGLEGLFLAGNHLKGTLPSEFGRLSQLENFEVSENALSGQIPTQLGNLVKLQGYLGLDNNKFKGSVPSELSRLAHVSSLSLASNRLSMPLPTEIGLLTKLTALFLGHNKIRGKAPSQLGKLVGLSDFFELESNSFSGQIPSQYGRFSRLVEGFNLGHNVFTGTIPTELGNLESLTASFDLQSNQFDHRVATLPSQLGRLGSLERLFMLNECGVGGSVPSQLGKLRKLEVGFYLYDNTLTGVLPSELGQLRMLESSFSVWGNELCGDLPPEVEALSGHVLTDWSITFGNEFGTPCNNATWTDDLVNTSNSKTHDNNNGHGGSAVAADASTVIIFAAGCGATLMLLCLLGRAVYVRFWLTRSRAYKISKFPRHEPAFSGNVSSGVDSPQVQQLSGGHKHSPGGGEKMTETRTQSSIDINNDRARNGGWGVSAGDGGRGSGGPEVEESTSTASKERSGSSAWRETWNQNMERGSSTSTWQTRSDSTALNGLSISSAKRPSIEGKNVVSGDGVDFVEDVESQGETIPSSSAELVAVTAVSSFQETLSSALAETKFVAPLPLPLPSVDSDRGHKRIDGLSHNHDNEHQLQEPMSSTAPEKKTGDMERPSSSLSVSSRSFLSSLETTSDTTALDAPSSGRRPPDDALGDDVVDNTQEWALRSSLLSAVAEAEAMSSLSALDEFLTEF